MQSPSATVKRARTTVKRDTQSLVRTTQRTMSRTRKSLRHQPDRASVKLIGAAAGGGIAAGLVLGQLNPERRHQVAEQGSSLLHGAQHSGTRTVRRATGRARGAVHAAGALRRPDREYDDFTLADKVKSELLRPADAPKGRVLINSCGGVVDLRGQLDSQDEADRLARRARRIEGVKDVRNLIRV